MSPRRQPRLGFEGKVDRATIRELLVAVPASQEARINAELSRVRQQMNQLQAEETRLARQLTDHTSQAEDAIFRLYERLKEIVEPPGKP